MLWSINFLCAFYGSQCTWEWETGRLTSARTALFILDLAPRRGESRNIDLNSALPVPWSSAILSTAETDKQRQQAQNFVKSTKKYCICNMHMQYAYAYLPGTSDTFVPGKEIPSASGTKLCHKNYRFCYHVVKTSSAFHLVLVWWKLWLTDRITIANTCLTL